MKKKGYIALLVLIGLLLPLLSACATTADWRATFPGKDSFSKLPLYGQQKPEH